MRRISNRKPPHRHPLLNKCRGDSGGDYKDSTTDSGSCYCCSLWTAPFLVPFKYCLSSHSCTEAWVYCDTFPDSRIQEMQILCNMPFHKHILHFPISKKAAKMLQKGLQSKWGMVTAHFICVIFLSNFLLYSCLLCVSKRRGAPYSECLFLSPFIYL